MPLCQNQTKYLKEGLKENSHNKTRKRNCSSSSSSSSLMRRYRFKRAIFVGKKGGSTTPVPTWKTNTTSPSMDTTQLTKTKTLHSSGFGLPSNEKEEFSVSARKLAATLWEINDLHPSNKDFEFEQMRSCKETTLRSREKGASFSRSGLLKSLLSDPSNSPTSEVNSYNKVYLFIYIGPLGLV